MNQDELNAKALELLKASKVVEFNQLRIEHPEWVPYLGGADLRDANLKGVDLGVDGSIGADLSYSDLQGANFEGANLQKIGLVGADLRGAKFIGVNLEGAFLMMANIDGADFRDANLRRANLQRTRSQRANLEGADLEGADLRKANELTFADQVRAALLKSEGMETDEG